MRFLYFLIGATLIHAIKNLNFNSVYKINFINKFMLIVRIILLESNHRRKII